MDRVAYSDEGYNPRWRQLTLFSYRPNAMGGATDPFFFSKNYYCTISNVNLTPLHARHGVLALFLFGRHPLDYVPPVSYLDRGGGKKMAFPNGFTYKVHPNLQTGGRCVNCCRFVCSLKQNNTFRFDLSFRSLFI